GEDPFARLISMRVKLDYLLGNIRSWSWRYEDATTTYSYAGAPSLCKGFYRKGEQLLPFTVKDFNRGGITVSRAWRDHDFVARAQTKVSNTDPSRIEMGGECVPFVCEPTIDGEYSNPGCFLRVVSGKGYNKGLPVVVIARGDHDSTSVVVITVTGISDAHLIQKALLEEEEKNTPEKCM